MTGTGRGRSWLRSLGANGALAAAYFVVGAVVVKLPWGAPPKAAAVWPSAGIALAALLRWGPGLLPGVLVGGLASGLVYGLAIGFPVSRMLPCALLLGAGSTLQAWVGAMLVLRWVPRWATLDDERSVGLFLVIAGPLASLISASVGSASLLLVGALTPVELPFHWWSWFVGNTVGALIVAPMIVVWSGGSPRVRRVSITLVLAVAFTLVIAIFIRADRWEENRLATQTRRRVELVGRAVERVLSRGLDTLSSVADLYQTLPGVDGARFRRFVSQMLAREPALMAVAWLPPGSGGDRGALEVVRRQGSAAGVPGELEGVDEALWRRATAEVGRIARASAWPTAHAGTVLLVAPVAPRPGAQGGVSLSTLRLEEILTASWDGGGRLELVLHEPGGPRAVYARPGPRPQGGEPARESASQPALLAFPFEAGGRDWELRAVLTSRDRAQDRSWQAWIVLAVGMAFLALLEAFLLVVSGRASRVENVVSLRTSELEESRRAIEEQRAELALSNAELAGALQAKEVLLKELHHRVKNNLQVISSLFSLQARYITDPRHREIFEESRNRVFSIALAHEKLYRSKDLARIDFSEYARTLVDHLHSMFGANTAITVETDLNAVTLPVETAIPCGLVLNELVTNAFKHAFPDGRCGRIRVVLRETTADRWLVAVEDDGVGLPVQVQLGRTESLGLDLVSILAAQLGAKVEIERGRGTRFSVTFGRDRRADA